jgi:hypothetical protein
MRRIVWLSSIIAVIVLGCTIQSYGQKSSLGGRFGLSIGSGGGESAAGLQLGPTFDYEFNKGMIIGSELNINTQTGTPIEWADYFKYVIPVQSAKVSPYVDGGLGLWFATGGPYFGLRFGGGSYFKVGENLYVPADLQLGPIFATGTTVFYFAITTGIRYTLP